MKCVEVTERIPWLLNETLPAGERAEVVAHLKDCAGCRRELQETSSLMEELEHHPDIERLVEYVFKDEMEAPERNSIDQHIAGCQRCRTELELVRKSHMAMPTTPSRTLRFIGIAAALLMAVSAAVLWRAWRETRQRESVLTAKVRTLEEQVSRMAQPSASGQIIDLLPSQSLQRSTGASGTAAATGAGTETTFLLNSRIALNASACSIRLVENAKDRWSAREPVRGTGGEFLVRVPSGFLTTGQHRLIVTCGAVEETYDFTVR